MESDRFNLEEMLSSTRTRLEETSRLASLAEGEEGGSVSTSSSTTSSTTTAAAAMAMAEESSQLRRRMTQVEDDLQIKIQKMGSLMLEMGEKNRLLLVATRKVEEMEAEVQESEEEREKLVLSTSAEREERKREYSAEMQLRREE